MAKATLFQTFWQNLNRKEDGCWEWNRTRIKDGYGHLSVAGKLTLAHRVAYTLTYGAIADGLSVLHSCDNPPCCNPLHLKVGTHAENMRERDERRGRYHLTRESGNKRARYSAQQINALLLEFDALPKGPRGALANGMRSALLQKHAISSRVLDYALKVRRQRC